jgi:hypothetical protein
MGFNKRFVDSKVINTYLERGKGFDDLFKADAFIFLDKMGSEVYKWYSKGLTDDEIKLNIQKYHESEESQTINV